MVEGTQVIARSCGGVRQVIPKICGATVQEETGQGGEEEQSEDTEEGMGWDGDDLGHQRPSHFLAPPRSSAPPDLQIPREGPVQVDPCEGGRSSSVSREVPAAPSLPWVGRGRGDLGRIKTAKMNLSGSEGASHIPAGAGKGKCQQGGHGGGDGSSWGTG